MPEAIPYCIYRRNESEPWRARRADTIDEDGSALALPGAPDQLLIYYDFAEARGIAKLNNVCDLAGVKRARRLQVRRIREGRNSFAIYQKACYKHDWKYWIACRTSKVPEWYAASLPVEKFRTFLEARNEAKKRNHEVVGQIGLGL